MATTTHPFTYDVFLSFRGEDTRKNFTDHLYTALKRSGFRTFRDDDAMDRGRLLGPELKKAIHQSKISIIVFSENYATSKWCLDEVKAIIKEQERVSSKHEVIPVFYKVDPSDVRNQRGRFEEAFAGYHDIMEAETDHRKKMEWMEKMEEWRVSLWKASNLTGMVLADGHEAEFVSQILNVVKKTLDYKALYVEKNLVGLNAHVSKIELWLNDPSPDAVILLIDGMGGIGKTTIAKCVYNSNYRDYDASCFLLDITETSNQTGGMVRLQSHLLSNILKSEKEETIWNVAEGATKVTNAICNKKVLLVLDDVTDLQQFNKLLGGKRFYPGSKVIITTRHKSLSMKLQLHPENQLTIETLSASDSLKLFSLHAFNQDQPTEPYIVQSKLAVDYCNGLPLALVVLGSSLCGRTNDVWNDILDRLEKYALPKIQKVLQISYETLEDDNNKQVFLHIACFFVGEEKNYIVKLLAECDLFPVVGIDNLLGRCLLHVENGVVVMHQLMKEMGREVVRQESPEDHWRRSRLWDHDDCFNVLQDHSVTSIWAEIHSDHLDLCC